MPVPAQGSCRIVGRFHALSLAEENAHPRVFRTFAVSRSAVLSSTCILRFKRPDYLHLRSFCGLDSVFAQQVSCSFIFDAQVLISLLLALFQVC
jgi:hypothetical protein